MLFKLPSKKALAGFTLIEISIVVALIAVLLGGGLVLFTSSLEKQQYDETNRKIEMIQKALLDYRRAQDRIPCPADATLPMTDSDFGLEAENAGSCDGSPDVNFDDAANTVGGMVPNKTLRLPDDIAIDGWGNRIMYFIDKRYSADSAFTTYEVDDAVTGTMTVNDATGAARTTKGIIVVLSHGPNGHGAFARVGSATRLNASISNTDELQNCNCNASAVATAFNTTFVQKILTQDSTNLLNTFDDVLDFRRRSDMRSYTE